MSSYEIYLAIGVFVPLVTFALLVFFGYRLGKPLSGWVAVAGMGVSLVLATITLARWMGETPEQKAELTAHAARYTWADLGNVPTTSGLSAGSDAPAPEGVRITVGVKLDSLTVIMYFMVTFVGFWIFVFSLGYMAGHSDEIDGQCKFHRFFTYLSLFAFSMLGLVVSSSLLFLFIFWELVGLCSYFLIGFYFDRKYASNAGIKAFVTNRVGDFGFIIGLMLVFFYLRTLDLDQAAATFAEQYHAGTGIFASQFTLFGYGLATLMGIGLFCGAIGKSAQFPLQVWLPDAMAGPTPVSALIHAATMVAAGVYLVARIFRLLTPEAQMFVATIGCITLTITALIAMVQTDIKKVLAYSTLSQLGYMIFGMGVGAWIAALFHLMTHAFFKAMLFLGSGQVIEGCHHEQDIRNMGGLRRKMPVTCWTFFVGVLAIAGAGIPWLTLGDTKFGLGGFFSKDEILAVAYERTYNWDYAQRVPVPEELWVQGEDEPNRDRQGAERIGDWGLGIADWKSSRRGGWPTASAVGDTNPNRFEFPTSKEVGHPIPFASPAGGATGHSVPSSGARALLVADREEHGAPNSQRGARLRTLHDSPKFAVAAKMLPLPKWLFWLPILIAYVTPFYMMRVWWLTFMGKPRNEHVYHHAHEMKLMYVPLIVLAVGTWFSSYFVFRPLLAEAAPAATDAPAIVALDGEAHHPTDKLLSLTHVSGRNPHTALGFIVGFAFIVGMGLAWMIYRNAFALSTKIRTLPVVRYLHAALEKKLYFDHLYEGVLVPAVKTVLAGVCNLFDMYVIDLLANLSAKVTERVSAFSGWVLDARGVDGVVNGIADTALEVGDAIRRPQTGLIRNYVLLAAGGAVVVVLCVLLLVT
ncbi:MAG: NADH-quinone oxidoreductase subunit L [Planctomycetota bacterium]